jgi:hypothetical protein
MEQAEKRVNLLTAKLCGAISTMQIAERNIGLSHPTYTDLKI